MIHWLSFQGGARDIDRDPEEALEEAVQVLV